MGFLFSSKIIFNTNLTCGLQIMSNIFNQFSFALDRTLCVWPLDHLSWLRLTRVSQGLMEEILSVFDKVLHIISTFVCSHEELSQASYFDCKSPEWQIWFGL